ncbi:MAG TPA: hypothetical protein VHL58_05450 [Thermoanaerobaculia bacterium]|nr:hypothetical protein [Thermoanaerobaculia bacterium]
MSSTVQRQFVTPLTPRCGATLSPRGRGKWGGVILLIGDVRVVPRSG